MTGSEDSVLRMVSSVEAVGSDLLTGSCRDSESDRLTGLGKADGKPCWDIDSDRIRGPETRSG
jgi:hypothetical protein